MSPDICEKCGSVLQDFGQVDCVGCVSRARSQRQEYEDEKAEYERKQRTEDLINEG